MTLAGEMDLPFVEIVVTTKPVAEKGTVPAAGR
jgi:hypothetical protein